MGIFYRKSMTTHIGIYDNVLSAKDCDVLINQFEKGPHQEGGFYEKEQYNINHSYKKSIQLKDSRFTNKSVISNIILPILKGCINKHIERSPSLKYIHTFGIDDYYNFQKYDGEDDGYKIWHSDRVGPRVLVWMFYLNNAKCGTEFMHYPTVRAKIGRCVIWPAGLTHMHKSQINKGLKYIISGWIGYEE